MPRQKTTRPLASHAPCSLHLRNFSQHCAAQFQHVYFIILGNLKDFKSLINLDLDKTFKDQTSI